MDVLKTRATVDEDRHLRLDLSTSEPAGPVDVVLVVQPVFPLVPRDVVVGVFVSARRAAPLLSRSDIPESVYRRRCRCIAGVF